MPIEVTIEFSDEFLAAVKKLRKRYRHIEDDLRPLISQLKRGEHPGDLLQGTTFEGIPYQVYKERLPNRDAQRGKSGGYRVIYYLQSQTLTILITIYSKSDQADISLEEIAGILRGVLEQKSASADETTTDSETPPQIPPL